MFNVGLRNYQVGGKIKILLYYLWCSWHIAGKYELCTWLGYCQLYTATQEYNMNVRCDLACHVRVGTLVKVVSNVNKCKYRPYYASLKIVMYAVT